ncbi:MAG: hypothetical protein OEM38_00370 [Gammaproteobacteria bacterium]|nr:hypothetical protein [Gammaproteobacteria bacterium]
MLANRVRETTATTGAGSFATAGAVAGFDAFNTAFGLHRRFAYWAINATDNEWETGIGYLSASATLVRETVLDNSAGTQVAINFTTAPILSCGMNETGTLAPPAIIATSGTNYEMLLSKTIVGYSSSYTARPTQLYLQPFAHDCQGAMSKWAVYVKTASVGAVMRMGIYRVDMTTGFPVGSPWIESDDIDCGTTGLVTQSFANNVVGPITAQRLPPYFFLGLAFEDSTIALMSMDYTKTTKTWMSKNANGADVYLNQLFTLGTPTPAVAALPAIATISYRAENQPIGGFAA